jgi:hypothetical protein
MLRANGITEGIEFVGEVHRPSQEKPTTETNLPPKCAFLFCIALLVAPLLPSSLKNGTNV